MSSSSALETRKTEKGLIWCRCVCRHAWFGRSVRCDLLKTGVRAGGERAGGSRGRFFESSRGYPEPGGLFGRPVLIAIYCAEAERSLAMEPGMMIAVIVGGLVAAGVAVYAGIQGAKKKDDDKK